MSIPSANEFSVRRDELGAWVLLPQEISETFDGPRLSSELEGSNVILFDWSRTHRITSFGVREWMRFLRSLPAESYYGFVRCTPMVVAQINTIGSFVGRGEVLSLYLPYECPKCGDRADLLLDITLEKQQSEEVRCPRLDCDRCGIASDLEEPPEVYLSHVSRQPCPSPPPAAVAVLERERKK
jgi:hypothetical protein